jgi:hypothetical protein
MQKKYGDLGRDNKLAFVSALLFTQGEGNLYLPNGKELGRYEG